ncbi:MAG TPA: MarR family winged helix-turn-helix transcriptional regulator [Methylomirabilota bacterium]|nr:MarR family winged helix-turn-helix transcriptional regulator [Methylomirabilota bacterium]
MARRQPRPIGRIPVGSPSPCVCDTLRMATRAVTQLYDDVLRPSGLRVTQFSVLARIARMGEASVGQLAHALAIDQTTLTRGVTLLERDGLTERAPLADARVKSLRLTAEGRRVLETALPLWTRAQGLVLRELGAAGWTATRRRLGRLLHVAVEKRTARRRRRSPAR